MRGGCISAFSALRNNNLASTMASDFGRAGPDETKPHCKSCELENSFTPQTQNSSWRCTYDELGQGAANGCPRCRFVAACITTIKEHLEIDEIRKIYAYPWRNEFYLEMERGDFYLDVFIEDRETGESSRYWPTNSTDLFRETWSRPTWRVK